MRGIGANNFKENYVINSKSRYYRFDVLDGFQVIVKEYLQVNYKDIRQEDG